ncbi:MAG: 30S ribosomal protein S3 [Anaeromicrobium sp.]|jgi:small subunit ribosomal protein S3|uniref:30S ribosomal protein S3 n=1 Tax=Anaeromicrobium sp. TaxID=1929132 RepID=UPI0025DC6BBA|nr:30S ribosomal protein S3 [Anaeromicrobium sp.]MCT4594497.1 30S ribosomal protein S3 [Anaeromicrobium sp.]
MGQKVNPNGLRVGVIKDWDSKWYADKKNFADLLIEDNKIRKFVKNKLYTSGISKVVIERAANNKVKVNIFTAKPGMVIGKGGSGVETLRKDIEKLVNKSGDVKTVFINVNEVRRSEKDAQLVAENVAFSLERRVSFRRAMKQAIQRAMRAGVPGIKVMVSGRLGGAEMARNEMYHEGNVPLHTIRANIDYGFAEADTTYGKIGVKVWINHGEVLPQTAEEVKAQRRANRDKNFNRDNRKPRNDRRNNRNDKRNNFKRRENNGQANK